MAAMTLNLDDDSEGLTIRVGSCVLVSNRDTLAIAMEGPDGVTATLVFSETGITINGVPMGS